MCAHSRALFHFIHLYLSAAKLSYVRAAQVISEGEEGGIFACVCVCVAVSEDKRWGEVGRDFQVPGTLRWIMKILGEQERERQTHTLTGLYDLWGGWCVSVCVWPCIKQVWGPAAVMRDTDVFSYGFVSPLHFPPTPKPSDPPHTHSRFVCVCVYVRLNGLTQAVPPGWPCSKACWVAA